MDMSTIVQKHRDGFILPISRCCILLPECGQVSLERERASRSEWSSQKGPPWRHGGPSERGWQRGQRARRVQANGQQPREQAAAQGGGAREEGPEEGRAGREGDGRDGRADRCSLGAGCARRVRQGACAPRPRQGGDGGGWKPWRAQRGVLRNLSPQGGHGREGCERGGVGQPAGRQGRLGRRTTGA